MLETPSAVSNKKRKTPASTPSARKRTKVHEDAATGRAASVPRLRKQRTLTQIEFVSNPSLKSVEDVDLEDLPTDVGSARTQTSMAPPPPLLRRRSSIKSSKRQRNTLTQMDFLASGMDSPDEDMNELQIDRKHSELPGQSNPPISTISTTDGVTEEEPRTSNQRSAGGRKKGSESAIQSSSKNARRRSSRILEKSTWQDDGRSLNPTDQSTKRSGKTYDLNRPSSYIALEIADSTDFQELCSPPDISGPTLAPLAAPRTPSKTRDIVPSSQSPESLPPSARRSHRVVKQWTYNSSARKPLAELSTNIQTSKRAKSPAKLHSSTSPTTPSRKRKVCVLKVPSLAVPTNGRAADRLEKQEPWKPRRSPRILDRQDGSQPKPTRHVSFVTHHANKKSEEDVLEIPGTSQASKDPALHTAASLDPGEHVLPDADEQSDFGSPIANDTQFNLNLDQPTSSPVRRASQGQSGEPRPQATTDPSSMKDTQPGDEASKDDIPTPRLVPTASKAGSPESALTRTTSSTESLALLREVNSHVSTRKVPLNDTQNAMLTSSPNWAPFRATTQGSIHPAALPRPSQLSTQEPTQLMLPSTMSPRTSQARPRTQTERITIKESSSNLDCIPQHEVDGEAATESELASGVDEELDDLDLDPTDTPRPKHLSFPPNHAHSVGGGEIKQEPTRSFSWKKRSVRARRVAADVNEADLLMSSSSPIITGISTRAERDAELEVVNLHTSSSTASVSSSPRPANLNQQNGDRQSYQDRQDRNKDNERPQELDSSSSSPPSTPSQPRHRLHLPHQEQGPLRKKHPYLHDHHNDHDQEESQNPSSPLTSLSTSSPEPAPLRRKYSPIPGFDNDTQSNYTVDGHITAAYIHRQRELGLLPDWFTPQPFQVKTNVRGAKSEGQGSGERERGLEQARVGSGGKSKGGRKVAAWHVEVKKNAKGRK